MPTPTADDKRSELQICDKRVVRIVLPPLLAVVIFTVDVVFRRWFTPLPITAVLDESAHVATVLLFVAVLAGHLSRTHVLSALLASVVIDLDHLPRLLGSTVISQGIPRPYGHALLTIVVVLLFAWAVGRPLRSVALGVAFGLAAHFVRDVVTGDGLALFWPITSVSVRLPYWSYAVTIISLVLLDERPGAWI